MHCKNHRSHFDSKEVEGKVTRQRSFSDSRPGRFLPVFFARWPARGAWRLHMPDPYLRGSDSARPTGGARIRAFPANSWGPPSLAPAVASRASRANGGIPLPGHQGETLETRMQTRGQLYKGHAGRAPFFWRKSQLHR